MRIKHYAHLLILIAVTFGVISLYGAWYVYVSTESAKAVSLAKEIQSKKQNTQRAQDAKGELERALTDELAIKGYFVDTTEVVSFLESIQTAGAALGSKVIVDSVSSEPAKPHTVLVLSFHITGTFDSVLRTLGSIEYQARDTVLSSVTLDTPGAQETAPAVWTAAVTARVGTTDTSPVATTTPKS